MSSFSIFLFLKKAVDYITSGEKRCAWHFAKKLEESIRSSYLLPEYYQERGWTADGQITDETRSRLGLPA